MRRISLTFAVILTAAAGPALAQQCGGDYGTWLNGVLDEARASGVGERGLSALSGARYSKRVISRDRGQGVFAQSFLKFSGRMVSSNRLTVGKQHLKTYASQFAAAESEYGVPGAVITGFWGLETDFGAVQGDFNTINALATLAYDCRRPQLFRPQLIAAGQLVDRGDLPLSQMVGAWAGEIGQTQFLPGDYLRFGVDADGDGRVDLKGSKADVIASTANFIRGLGWRAGEPWLEEVRVSDGVPWQEADLYISHPRSQWQAWGVARRDGSPLPGDNLAASLVLPMGRNGPAFLAYPNFRIYLEWNQSAVYTVTAAYFATRLAGARKVDPGKGVTPLSIDQVKALQQRLASRGYDVGKIDGIIGANTRAAVKAEQIRLGLPPDSYPTAELLQRL